MADVLVCASSITGHVAPMLAIASHLRDAGHTVRMITGSRFGDRVSATGAEFLPLRGAADIDDTNLDLAFPGRVEATGIAKVKFDLSHLFLATMRPQWDLLSAELNRRPCDVVLYETAFTGIAPLLAGAAARPPVIGCGVIPMTLASPHVPPFGPGIRYAAGPTARLRNRNSTPCSTRSSSPGSSVRPRPASPTALRGQGCQASSWTVSHGPTRSCS